MDNLKQVGDKIIKIKRLNMFLGIVINIFFSTIIFWALFNDQKNLLGEKVFLSLSIVVLSYSIYLLNKYTRIFPPPNIETEKTWKGYVINNIESSISAATYWELGVLYPLFIASIGIFAMELERDREIYLSVVGTSLFLGAMFWCADWTIRNAKKCYEEVTGSKHIKFFIYLRTRP